MLIRVLIIFITIALNLQAEYLRKITVASYLSEKDAQVELAKMQKGLAKDTVFVRLQNEHKFAFGIYQSGRYYTTIISPFFSRSSLQESVDVVRKYYKDAYVKKISRKDISASSSSESVGEERKTTLESELEVLASVEVHESPASVVDVASSEVASSEKSSVSSAPLKQVETSVSSQTILLQPKEEPIVNITHSEESRALTQQLFYILYAAAILIAVLLLFSIVLFSKYRRLQESNRLLERQHKQDKASIVKHTNDLNAQEQFLAKISHELRTPMNAIIGLSHIVLQSDLKQSLKENISKIKYSGELLLEIINDILDMSKMSAGELKLESVEFDINDVLDHVSNTIAIKNDSTKVNLTFDIDKCVPPKLVGDPLRFGQILINLLSNALKFTHEGDVDLSITCKEHEGDKVELICTVSDTGIGMTEDQIKKLFKRFTQATDSTTRLYGGTGLGLSIVKQLLDMMGGEINVKSRYGSGSEFSFNLAFALKDGQNMRKYRLPSKELMRKNVLIIDTNKKNITSLRKKLEYFHYKVQVVPTCEEMQMKPQSGLYDLVFIDETKLSKYALSRINALKNEHAVKLVLMESLFSQKNQYIRELDVIDYYLSKPFSHQNIFAIILEVFAQKSRKAELVVAVSKKEIMTLNNKRILIAEDNAINQKVVAGLLDATPLSYEFADNGKEAIEKLKKSSKYDLILMDISMPVMDGYEATKVIREYHEYDAIPIVALSANVLESEIEHGLENGMNDFMHKPINIGEFYSKLYNFLKNGSEAEVQEEVEPEVQAYIEENLATYKSEFLVSTEAKKKCDCDDETYKAILKDFYGMYRNSDKTFRHMIKESNLTDALQLAQDIKKRRIR